MATALLIDGQNFLGNIKSVLKKERIVRGGFDINWRNFDFNKLFNRVLGKAGFDYKLFYIAKLDIHPKTKEKSKELIKRQRLLTTHLREQGFRVVIAGRVRGFPRKDSDEPLFTEKGVDVQIAVDMLAITILDKKAEKIILASSDSDLQPVIREVRKRKQTFETIITYLGFEDFVNKGLTYTTHKTILIRNSEVLSCYKKQYEIKIWLKE